VNSSVPLPTAGTTLAVALGAGLGALGRWLTGLLAAEFADLPLGTFLVNVVGAFLIGVLLARWAVLGPPSQWAPFLTTGVLGGFTTFSALAVETVLLWDAGRAGWAAAYVAATATAGLVAVRLGSRWGLRGRS
jgi:CrcB protein